MTAWTNTAPPICGPRNRNKKGEQKLREPTFVCAVNTVTEVWARQERYERRRSCEVHTHTHRNPLFMPVALWSMPFQFSQAKHDFYSSKNQEKKKGSADIKENSVHYSDQRVVLLWHANCRSCAFIYYMMCAYIHAKIYKHTLYKEN